MHLVERDVVVFTRREFVQTAGAASLALASTKPLANGLFAGPLQESRRSTTTREPTYLGGNARYWLSRLANRNVVEYDRLDELNNDSRDQVYRAVAAFGELVVPELRRMLFRRPGQARAAAFQVLSRMAGVGEAVLIEAAGDPRGYLRAEAVSTLAHGFPLAAELPTLMLTALDDDVDQVRLAAARSLWCLGPLAKPHLDKALRHADPVVRREAVSQVWRIDPDPMSATPRLLELLDDEDLEVRWRAVESIFVRLPVDSRVVPAVCRLIHEGVVAGTNYLPLAGSEGFAQLLKLLADSNVVVRAAASAALANVVCGAFEPESTGSSNPFSAAEAAQLKAACLHAAQDNDLAVQFPAQRILAALGG